jgi:hypothetical protein
LEVGLSTDLKSFEQVRQALANLGFELKTSEQSASGVKMSNDLREVMKWIIGNRGIRWMDI